MYKYIYIYNLVAQTSPGTVNLVPVLVLVNNSFREPSKPSWERPASIQNIFYNSAHNTQLPRLTYLAHTGFTFVIRPGALYYEFKNNKFIKFIYICPSGRYWP